jgi:hypothetical protein
MVEATDFANRDDPAEFRRFNEPAVGRILVERQVGARSVVYAKCASREGRRVQWEAVPPGQEPAAP